MIAGAVGGGKPPALLGKRAISPKTCRYAGTFRQSGAQGRWRCVQITMGRILQKFANRIYKSRRSSVLSGGRFEGTFWRIFHIMRRRMGKAQDMGAVNHIIVIFVQNASLQSGGGAFIIVISEKESLLAAPVFVQLALKTVQSVY